MIDIVSTQSSPSPHAPLAVVTVTYSPGDHLASFVGSLATSTTRPTRTVLADNGSTDGVPEALAAADDTVTFLPTGGNVGYGSAINAAARHLAGARTRGEIDTEFFLISNPDVSFTPGSVDSLIDAAHRWPNAAAVGPRIVENDGATYPSARAVPTMGTGIGHALLGPVWPNNPWSAAYRDNADMDTERVAGWLSGSCLLVRWEAFDAVGGFDERYFMYMEDVDLGDRFARAGFENIYTPTSIIHHDQGHSTKSRRSTMLPAHHRSAYRFQADRHPKAWQAPLRWALRVGLAMRGLVVVGAGRR